MAGGQQFKKRLPMSIKNQYQFTELNEAQIEAVKTVNGPLLVLAGAGTGKTRVLTSRLSYILQNNIAHPSQICTVTFTNKAANEMRIRVEKMIGNSVAGWWLGTFHSLAARILRSNAELVNLKNTFTIIDTDDQIRLVKQVLSLENIDEKRWPARSMLSIIQRWKDMGLNPIDVKDAFHSGTDFANNQAIKLYKLYQYWFFDYLIQYYMSHQFFLYLLHDIMLQHDLQRITNLFHSDHYHILVLIDCSRHL